MADSTTKAPSAEHASMAPANSAANEVVTEKRKKRKKRR